MIISTKKLFKKAITFTIFVFKKKNVQKSNNICHLCIFKNLHKHLNQYIQDAKQNCINKIAQKLGDPNTRSRP